MRHNNISPKISNPIKRIIRIAEGPYTATAVPNQSTKRGMRQGESEKKRKGDVSGHAFPRRDSSLC